jgi:hypothetical protein
LHVNEPVFIVPAVAVCAGSRSGSGASRLPNDRRAESQHETVPLGWIRFVALDDADPFGAAWRVAMMASTWRQEKEYLISAEEVDAVEGIHAIRGCRQIPCAEEDAIYFRVRGTLAHTIWSVVARGTFIYPDCTASVVAPGVNLCDVTSYGIRVTALIRGWDLYPDMLYATCTRMKVSRPSPADPDRKKFRVFLPLPSPLDLKSQMKSFFRFAQQSPIT